MTTYNLIDVAPAPVAIGSGIAVLVVLFVIGFVILLGAALVIFLWWRKRRMRHQQMIRPVDSIPSVQR
jgi:Flp pilus assembly protein TadB